jgi:hypothetical protein
VKQNVIAYWREDPRMKWPVKVISAQRGVGLGAALGRLVSVRGCVVSAKFVLGWPLPLAERILGLCSGELGRGAVLLRLNRLPEAHEFDLATGYTNVAAYAGYPPGLGSNQSILAADISATVQKARDRAKFFKRSRDTGRILLRPIIHTRAPTSSWLR